jgi:hypothetical protein
MAGPVRTAILPAVIAVSMAVAFVSACTPAALPAEHAGSGGELNLPRIAWEGGPAYWSRFPAARAAGWANPDFFPVVMWYDSVSSDAEVRADESYGINTFIGEPASTNYELFAGNGAFVLNALSDSPGGGTAQPGTFLADEPDGQGPSSAAALTRIDNLVASASASASADGRFDEINFSATVISGSEPAVNKANFEAMVDSYQGPVSVDDYYYTKPSCFDIRYLMVPVDPGHCRTASSYGATVRAVRARLAAAGHLKPVWNFVEDLSGAPDAAHPHAYIQPGQLEGAVMDSIINEARGVLYFDQSFAGTCRSTNVIRQFEDGSLPCAGPQAEAVKQVDARIKALAPVINTQSYQYVFGPDLDTMLKTYNHSAYIFAMISGAPGSEPGKRTFTLPPQLADAAEVQVLNENRTIPVVGGKITDDFGTEYTYHIYKVAI